MHQCVRHLKPIPVDRLIYSLFPTDLGWIGMLGSECGLRRLVLPQPSAREALHLLVKDPQEALCNDLQYLSLWYRIRSYFAGQVVDFSGEILDIQDATPFQNAVWGVVRAIPYGETWTYKQIAGSLGKPASARAVGQALATNPVPIIIPCHRVVAAHGLGGYAGGLSLKEKLLNLEASALQRPANTNAKNDAP